MNSAVDSTDIKRLLMAWSHWRLVDSGANIGYPSGPAFARQIRTAGGWASKTPLITDEMAGKIDAAVSRLRLRCKAGDRRYEVLTDSYLFNMSDSAIARRLKLDRRTIMATRQAAESWVDSHIDYDLWISEN